MFTRFIPVAFALLAGIVLSLSCSGQTSPTVPEKPDELLTSEFQFIDLDENTHVLGIWNVVIDPVNLSIEAVPVRSAEAHFNITAMVMPPKCYDCFLAKDLVYDPATQIMTVDVGFMNPSGITGYDVRGIILEFGEMEFLNPDGYTNLFAYTPGEINPMVAFKTGIGQREFPGLTSKYETMEIYNPLFPGLSVFEFVVEASWPDNCKEPYEVEFQNIDGDLYPDGLNSPVLSVRALDWQNDIESVKVDLTPIGGTVVTLDPDPLQASIWKGPISCAPGTLEGDYDLLIGATTQMPFDQTPYMANYATVTVAQPPVPGEEIFGPTEQIASTPGQSFIWPRHSIAVTGDGTPHVVWVDNSPDFYSNIYHVNYSSRVDDAWTIPVQIDSVSGRAIYATIAADSNDVLHIVWEDERDHVLGSDVYYASSEDGFASETVILTGADGYRHVHPKIETGPDDTLHLGGHTFEFINIDDYEYDLFYTSKQPPAGFWDPVVSVVSTEGVVEAYPAISPAPGGGVYIAYSSDAGSMNSIVFTENTSGSFISPVTVAAGEVYQPSMDVAIDGTLLVAYFDKTGGTFSDIYMRFSQDTGQIWGSPVVISTSLGEFHTAPDIETTAEGDIHVAWHAEDEMGYPVSVFYREFLNGTGWLDIVTITGAAGAFPSMDSDADGHIHMVYEFWTPMEPPDQYNYNIYYRSSVPG